MTLTQYLAECKERLSKATPGAWHYTPDNDIDDWTLHNDEFTFIKQDDSGVPISKEDGELIASAPETINKLIRVVEKFERQLQRDKDVIEFCYMGLTKPKEVAEIEDVLNEANLIVAGE